MHHTIDIALIVIALNWIFSALVDSMETPDLKSSRGYRYWFAVLHRLAGNVRRATEMRYGALAGVAVVASGAAVAVAAESSDAH